MTNPGSEDDAAANYLRMAEEIERGRERNEELGDRLATAGVTIGQLSHERARLRGLLTRLEWAPDWDSDAPLDDPRCPTCAANRSDGRHLPDCWLAAELRRDPDD